MSPRSTLPPRQLLFGAAFFFLIVVAILGWIIDASNEPRGPSRLEWTSPDATQP